MSNWDEWYPYIKKLSTMKNVHCKVSGLPQADGTHDWTPEEFVPYVRKVFELFGRERVNFAGNWFVLNEFGDFSKMFNTLLEVLHILEINKED